MMFFICFLCVTLVQLFKYWKAGDEQANLLEYENLITEVHKIKGQITPAFLSKTLNNASLLVKTNPKKTTDMLLKTGHLLRYQLYDSNRNKVLLKSEINFLSNFLDLEKLNRDDFQYTIKTEGDLNNVFVIPMLFISIVQNIADKAALLHLSFAIDADILRFQCYSENGNNFSQEELSIIGKQFELLYPGSHALTLNAHAVELVINVSE
jgi:Putative regulator of cell autolysis